MVNDRSSTARPDAKPRLRPLGKLLQRPGRDRGDIQLQTIARGIPAQRSQTDPRRFAEDVLQGAEAVDEGAGAFLSLYAP